MFAVRLVRYDLLDPRPPDEAARRPIDRAVNIPLDELPRRTFELPLKSKTIRVAGPLDLARAAVAWLEHNGRRARVTERVEYVPKLPDGEIGRLWEPTALLSEVLPQLVPGAALDLACGTGRDAVYLASCGWEVTAVDVLPDALARAQELASRCAAAIRPIRWIQCDLERDTPRFDRQFDLIVMFRYLNRALLGRLDERLSPGGSVLCETFTTLHRKRHGKPARADRALRPGELATLLTGLECRHYSEAWRGSVHTARLWARRPSRVE